MTGSPTAQKYATPRGLPPSSRTRINRRVLALGRPQKLAEPIRPPGETIVESDKGKMKQRSQCDVCAVIRAQHMPMLPDMIHQRSVRVKVVNQVTEGGDNVPAKLVCHLPLDYCPPNNVHQLGERQIRGNNLIFRYQGQDPIRMLRTLTRPAKAALASITTVIVALQQTLNVHRGTLLANSGKLGQ